MHVFFEDTYQGAAYDEDGDGLDDVETEMVELSLSGFEPEIGQVHLRLDPRLRTLGRMEETADNTSGVLDIRPFAASGSADSFFDVFLEIEFASMVMYGEGPMRLVGTLNEKPAAPGDIYQFSDRIRLMNEKGEITGYTLGTTRYQPIACGDAAHPYPVGDANHDCRVNLLDVAIVGLHWLECTRPECN